MDILGSLFSKPDATPLMDKLDLKKTLGEGADYNIGTIDKFKEYAPDLTNFMSDLYKQTVDPRALDAQSKAYSIGNQLADKGQTDLMGDFFDYARRQGLETAAATGSPISGSFTQSYGANLGAQQLYKNQLQGLNILGGQADRDRSLSQGFMNPALGLFQQNMVTPGQALGVGQYNNEIGNQNKLIQFSNDQRQSWFDTLLTDTLKSVVSTPFSLLQNTNSMVANAPQTAVNMCGGGGGGGGMPMNTYGGGGGGGAWAGSVGDSMGGMGGGFGMIA